MKLTTFVYIIILFLYVFQPGDLGDLICIVYIISHNRPNVTTQLVSVYGDVHYIAYLQARYPMTSLLRFFDFFLLFSPLQILTFTCPAGHQTHLSLERGASVTNEYGRVFEYILKQTPKRLTLVSESKTYIVNSIKKAIVNLLWEVKTPTFRKESFFRENLKNEN